jgi:DNA-binding beta-propeller fold protein YncE
VDAQGNVYVMDTGNKRVVIFDPQGKPLGQFGKAGMEPGQFDEPVGIALDSDGKIYIDDTWNQRVQVMSPDKSGNYPPLTSWEIAGLYGNSVDNKPYIAVDQMGHVFVTDPLGYRVLEFTTQGQFIRFWGDSGTGPDGFGQFINGIAVDSKGGVWVCDAFNNRIMHFTLPPE